MGKLHGADFQRIDNGDVLLRVIVVVGWGQCNKTLLNVGLDQGRIVSLQEGLPAIEHIAR